MVHGLWFMVVVVVVVVVVAVAVTVAVAVVYGLWCMVCCLW